MENKEIKKPEEVKNDQTKQIPFAEERLKYHSEVIFEFVNKSINAIRNMLTSVWESEIKHDKDIAYKNPYETLVAMLEWYIKDTKELYAKNMQEQGFKLTKEAKKELKDIKANDKNQPAEVKPAKQVNKLIMG